MLWGCMHDHQQSPLDIPNHLSPHRFYFPVAASLIVDTPVRTGRPVIKWRIASICHHLPASFHNGLHNWRPWCASPHNYITQKKGGNFILSAHSLCHLKYRTILKSAAAAAPEQCQPFPSQSKEANCFMMLLELNWMWHFCAAPGAANIKQ